MSDIIDDYGFKRLSDGRLQARTFSNLTDKEQFELIETLKEVAPLGMTLKQLEREAHTRMGEITETII